MEITLVSEHSIRIKGKKGVILVDPTAKIPKTPADAIIEFNSPDISSSKVEGHRITIDGAGEYEVSTIKIKGEKNKGKIIYNFTVDSVEVLLARVEDITGEDKNRFALREAKDYGIVLLFADSPVPQEIVGSIEAKILAFFGQDAANIKTVDGKSVNTTNKISVTQDKLPQDTEVVVLQ